MPRRSLGASGVTLSPVTFGSMRMELGAFPDSHWLGLFHLLADGGVTAFHSSHEYESYPRFCRIIRDFRRERSGAEIQHIVKLACPGFNDSRFDPRRFRSAIENELRALGTERLDVVQWLVRQTPNTDALRIPALRESLPQFLGEWEELRRAGKVRALTSFPYSLPFADELLQLDLGDGLAAYLNPVELEYADRLDDLSKRAQGFLAIRPMFAGKMSESGFGPGALETLGIPSDQVGQFCVSFPLLHPAVTTVIVSMSTLAHAQQNLKAMRTTANSSEFHRLSRHFAESNATTDPHRA